MPNKSPDDICEEYFDKGGARLSLKVMEDKGDGRSLLIEGDRQSLEFLGNLLLAQAQFIGDCGFQVLPIRPKDPFLASGSLGFYIHRIDTKGECDDDKGPSRDGL